MLSAPYHYHRRNILCIILLAIKSTVIILERTAPCPADSVF